ncbi:MAG: FecR domain-containing protein [Prolixibacteraceae bacterium]
MNDRFQKHKQTDFFEDPDFIEWALRQRPDLNHYFNKLVSKHPEKKESVEEARMIISSLEDEKKYLSSAKKVALWKLIRTDFHKQRKRVVYLKYAAVILPFVVLISAVVFYSKLTSDGPENFTSNYNRQDYTDTKLLLGNGQEIKIRENASEIIYDANSTIRVNDRLITQAEQTEKASFNQLSVPFGKKSKIILADNSVVWLNAGSRLTYPTCFKEKQRLVRLEGEAFFEISKNKNKPFIVETARSKIRVLGTSFNVKAYPDESSEETVLAEGSINMEFRGVNDRKGILMTPRQRIVFTNENKSYVVSNVNVEDYTSWTKGMFIFYDEPLPVVLRQVSRYYNLDITWDQKLDTLFISGKLDLREDYQKVLEGIALISDVKYTNTDRHQFSLQN